MDGKISIQWLSMSLLLQPFPSCLPACLKCRRLCVTHTSQLLFTMCCTYHLCYSCCRLLVPHLLCLTPAPNTFSPVTAGQFLTGANNRWPRGLGKGGAPLACFVGLMQFPPPGATQLRCDPTMDFSALVKPLWLQSKHQDWGWGDPFNS